MPINLATATPEQLVAEIRRARADIEASARYMATASAMLHAKSRRADFREAARQTATVPDGAPREVIARLQDAAYVEVSSTFMLYANTWQRYAGMVLQGVRRSSSAERIMQRLEDKRQLTTPEPPPVPRRASEPQPSTMMEDLVELYGVETVNHAQR